MNALRVPRLTTRPIRASELSRLDAESQSEVAARQSTFPDESRERLPRASGFVGLDLLGEQHARRHVEEGSDVEEVPVRGQRDVRRVLSVAQRLVLVGSQDAARHHEPQPRASFAERLQPVDQEDGRQLHLREQFLLARHDPIVNGALLHLGLVVGVRDVTIREPGRVAQNQVESALEQRGPVAVLDDERPDRILSGSDQGRQGLDVFPKVGGQIGRLVPRDRGDEFSLQRFLE